MPLFNLTVPTVGVRPFVARLADAGALATALANCEVRLYKNTIPALTDAVKATDLDAYEADYTGYTAGGVTVAAVGEPYTDGDGNIYVTVPSQQFNRGATLPGVDNVITHAALVDANGVLRAVAPLPQAVSMDGPSKSIVVAFNLLVS